MFPSAAAILERTGANSLRLVDLSSQSSLNADGLLAEDLRAWLVSGQGNPRIASLRALGVVPPWLDRVAGTPSVPLAPGPALELDGFETLFLELTGQCNERCVHCYAESAPEVLEALSRATCERVLDEAAALGFRTVQFTGGDPLLCGFLPAVLERSAALGFAKREIYTNGLLLSDPTLDRLAPFGPSFAFSFYSHDPARHDAITRTPGSQVRTLHAIDRVVSRGFGLRVNIVVMEQNASDRDATLALLTAHGVERIGVGETRAVGRGTHFDQGVSTRGLHSGEEAFSDHHGKICVSYDGTVLPCIFQRGTVLGHVGDRPLAEILRQPALPAPRVRNRLPTLDEAPPRLDCVSCRVTAEALGHCASEGGA